MAAGVRQKVILACTECKQRNYNTMKNKRNNPDRKQALDRKSSSHAQSASRETTIQ